MKKALIILLSTFITSAIAENDSTPSKYSSITSKKYDNYIGVSGGMITGFGISVKKWITNKSGIQINFFPYYQENKYPDQNNYDYMYASRDSGFSDNGTFSIGLTYLRNLADAKYIRFLVYVGSNAFIEYEKYDYYETQGTWNNDHYTNTIVHLAAKNVKTTFAGGGGFGAEWYVWRFAFNAMVGLRGTYNIYNDAKGIEPSIEGGVHFRF